MQIEIKPSFSEFKKLAKKGNLIPLYVDILADHLTPVSLLASGWNKSPYAFLLESVEGGEKLGRYSIVSFEPEAVVEQHAEHTEFKTPDGKILMQYREPLHDALARYMRCVKPVRVDGLPRFYGGAVGYFSYEIVHQLERVPRTNPDALGWPEAVFLITGDLFVFDNTQQLLKIITNVRIGKNSNLKSAYETARKKLLANVAKIRAVKPVFISGKKKMGKVEEFRSNITRDAFIKSVKTSKEHISKGDIIQVVVSRRQEKKTACSPLDIYRCLRIVNPSPYMYAIKLKDRAIIGSSPEALVRLENGHASTRPIAGTRRRGKSMEEDEALSKDLLQDPKERAEHLMLVDLARNDLGRVCEFSSVKVPLFMTIEKYSHVLHIVSEVVGKMRKGFDAFQLLKAVFPAGTVAGAPKIRAMEIINDVEKDQRGPYAGALGYFSYDGNMDMAITIRTILWNRGKISIQTGAGIVADSVPATEYQETENKAAAMKETIRLAESGALL